MSLPQISVLMSVYNGQRYLKDAIESILNQTIEEFEFIIVNDGSMDRTCEILEHYEKIDRRVRIVHNDKNIGLTKSLNKALWFARGEYVARMDADDISEPERLRSQIELLKSDKSIGCVGCDAFVIDEEGRTIKTVVLPKRNLSGYLRKRNCFVHGSLVFPMKVLQELGGYNEHMLFVQDYELVLRISQAYELATVRAFLYRLRKSRKSISSKYFLGQIYYTAMAKTLALVPGGENHAMKRKLFFLRQFLHSFIVIHKMGLPAILRVLDHNP